MPECHSTNSFALKLCQQSPLTADGTVVITSNQTAGRGQRGSTWQSEPGMNLTFSVIFKPAFLSVNQLFYLNVFSALAIRDYLTAKGCPEVLIKWPNDIYVNNKKLCGMLVRISLKGMNWVARWLVLTKPEISNSLKLTLPRRWALSLVTRSTCQTELEMVLSLIEARYLQLRQNKLPALMEDYLQSLYGWTKSIPSALMVIFLKAPFAAWIHPEGFGYVSMKWNGHMDRKRSDTSDKSRVQGRIRSPFVMFAVTIMNIFTSPRRIIVTCSKRLTPYLEREVTDLGFIPESTFATGLEFVRNGEWLH